MTEIASRGQLRLAFLRWAVVTVPFILLLGFASASLAPAGSQNAWYVALTKPGITPPDWVFPVVWSILYVFLGLALAMIINARGARGRGPAIIFFTLQMIANLIWTPVYFGMHQIDWALIILASLFVLAAITAMLFWRIRTGAGLLLLPYLAWILFAGMLLFQIRQLNPNAETLVPTQSSTQINL